MNSQSQSEWVIGLNRYSDLPLTGGVFSKFYSTASRLFSKLGVTSTHLGAEGRGQSGKFVRCSGNAAKRLVDSGFSEITVLSCVASTKTSKEPSFDREVSASLSWTPPGEIILSFVVNEGIAAFQSHNFEYVLTELLRFDDWSFGYAFRDLVARQPEFHVLSLDSGNLDYAESAALRRWYLANSVERTHRLRSVYPITIVNDNQLKSVVQGKLLSEIIEATAKTTVSRVGNLTVWRVPDAQVLALRKTLGETGGLIG